MVATESTLQDRGSSFVISEMDANCDELMRAQARELLLEYGRFVIAQPGAGRFCFGALEKEAERLPMSFQEQGGGCLIAQSNSEPVGFVAWRDIPPHIAADAWELKRLWVRPAGRGLGLGRALTLAVLDRARAARRTAVYLDTAPASMAAAHRLYLELGFTPCPPYNDNPVEGLAYLAKRL
jgi:ribosomal protein S18 acetylase RimI-like enzyme